MAFNNFPYTNFQDLNLDWIMRNVKTALLNSSDAVETANNLKNFVETYFDNLDVQEEINAKIDEMVESGEFLDTFDQLLPEIIEQWLEDNITPTTPVVDATLTISGAAADAKVTGDRTTTNDIRLNYIEHFNNPVEEIYCADIESGYYSVNTGEKLDSAAFVRSKMLYPISAGFYYSVTGLQTRACTYDENKNFIGSVYFNSKTAYTHTYIPENVKYIGLFLSSSATNTDYFELKRFTGSEVEVFEDPFEGNFLYCPNYWCNANGVIQATSNLSMIGVMNPVAGDRYYVCNYADAQALCKDSEGGLLDVTKITVNPYGQIIEIPNGAVVCYFNIYNNNTYEGRNNTYITKITGKKVLCIGDSVTWLDGHGPYGGAAHINGFQVALRKAGFEVFTKGCSGYPFAQGSHEQETEEVKYSIYNEIVNLEYDVTGYDYIVIMGGLNDIMYNTPLGERITSYSTDTFDSYTFNGAISGIIDYIRTNNPTVKIILCTTTKAEAVTRPFNKSILYENEIKYNAEFWSCKLCDVFTDMNVQPNYDNFDVYFYDNTHPNNKGMEIIGQLILNAVKSYE